MYQYNVCVYAPQAEWTCKTNDPRYATKTLFEYAEQGLHVEVINDCCVFRITPNPTCRKISG